MDSYTGEVRIFCGMYAPADWADCNGQLLDASKFPALYAVIGNTYGGTPGQTFAVPNLNGCVPVHQGAGTGLTPRVIGQGGGSATVTLTESQIPNHTHVPQALNNQGASTNPAQAVWAKTPKAGRGADTQAFAATPNTLMHALAMSATGNNQPHNNMQPYLPLRFIISLNGLFPVKP